MTRLHGMRHVHHLALLMGVLLIPTLYCGCSKTKPSSLCFEDLIRLNTNELAKVDVGLMNLLCARGLPGTENLDIPACMRTLDDWAAMVKPRLAKAESLYNKDPAHYENSLAKCKVIILDWTLKSKIGCGYNMDLVNSGAMTEKSMRFCEDPRDDFIHGLLLRKKGTCATLPVLTVAVGRRCGLPLYLVTTKMHLFCRWADDQERFNVDVAGGGLSFHDDDYYRHWPEPITPEEEWNEKYLRTLNPSQEFGIFMETRGTCLLAHKRPYEAASALWIACRMFPTSHNAQANLITSLSNRWQP